MIYAFNFTCMRDLDLSNLMVSTLFKHCDDLKQVVVINTDTDEGYNGYGNGSGWPQSLLKLKRIREFQPADTDFILSVDSDVVFTSPEVFKYIDPQYGIIGIKHRPDYYTHSGHWSHMSGALIFIRGDIAKKITSLSEFDLDFVRFSHFKPYSMTENEDVVLSYLCKFVGANHFDLGTVSGLSSGDFESDVFTHKTWSQASDINQIFGGERIEAERHMLKSFYHLNYCPTMFLGEPVVGKWDIPKVLVKKGIKL